MEHADETVLVREFFGASPGFFIEVGANEPREGSQTWHLEQRAWTGVLIEPQPALAERLRRERSARVFAAACSSPANAGSTLPLHVAGPMSSLNRERMAPGALPEDVIEVPVRTLDDILTESAAPVPVDFMSVDVEGHEIEALSGFTFARWQPRLVLLEDHVEDLRKHRFMTAAGYRLVRRTNFNGWYVPAEAKVAFGWNDRWQIWRKYFLALPFRKLRDFTRRLRQPAKDARARRDRSRGAG